MECGSVEEAVHKFDTLFSDGNQKPRSYFRPPVLVYEKRYLFKVDVNRCSLCFNINGREIFLSVTFRNCNQYDENDCLSLSKTKCFADFPTSKEVFDRVVEELKDHSELNE
jgi:hypothetical protein